MKPELIFINESNGKVTIAKEDFERIVDKAYQAGREDAAGSITIPYYPTWSDKAVPTKIAEITCNELV